MVRTHVNLYVLETFPGIRALQGPDAVIASESGVGKDRGTGDVRRWGGRQDNWIQGGPA